MEIEGPTVRKNDANQRGPFPKEGTGSQDRGWTCRAPPQLPDSIGSPAAIAKHREQVLKTANHCLGPGGQRSAINLLVSHTASETCGGDSSRPPPGS